MLATELHDNECNYLSILRAYITIIRWENIYINRSDCRYSVEAEKCDEIAEAVGGVHQGSDGERWWAASWWHQWLVSLHGQERRILCWGLCAVPCCNNGEATIRTGYIYAGHLVNCISSMIN